jgi:hypothetical protein
MKTINRRVRVIAGTIFLLLGCSSTQFTHHSRGVDPPFCKNGLEGSRAGVYWDTAWRQDQKEIELREKILAEGIGSFFGKTLCIKAINISRSIGSKPVSMCSEVEIMADARFLNADKAIVMRIEELGPNLMLYLSPILWQTKNEVVLRIKILDVRTNTIEADTASHWYRGGPFMLLGTDSLKKDLDGTLQGLFNVPNKQRWEDLRSHVQ